MTKHMTPGLRATAAEMSEARRLCLAEGKDPDAAVPFEWTDPDGRCWMGERLQSEAYVEKARDRIGEFSRRC